MEDAPKIVRGHRLEFYSLDDAEPGKPRKTRCLSVTRRSYHGVALTEEQIRQIGAVLSRNAADQRSHVSPSFRDYGIPHIQYYMGPISCGARLQLLYWAQGMLIVFRSCHSEGTPR